MLTIEILNNYQAERKYILSVIFTEFLGLDYQVRVCDRNNTKITLKESSNCELIINDQLFTTASENWLKSSSLPIQPLASWNINNTPINPITVSPQIPVIYGDNPDSLDFFQKTDNRIYIGLDIFGSAFFMLTRYEEIIKSERDRHNRFPATASLAYQEGFLDRPIINEYLEILWSSLQQLFPKLQRKNNQFKIYLSHDVDQPFRYAFMDIYSLAKSCTRDILKNQSINRGFNNISQWQQVKKGQVTIDPCNTFDKIMDLSDQHNLKSAFYFITDRSAGNIDGNYNINHPLIRNLLRNIYLRGHEIGLHTSYNTYQNLAQTGKELAILKTVCKQEGIQQKIWGVRQHYLRWETPTTWQNLNDIGLDYDTTLSFADVAGFRCGVCYEFSTFNVQSGQPLKLKERPLIVMECTIIDQRYMNFGLQGETVLKAFAKYKDRCRMFNGDFTLLWHNSRLIDKDEMNLYLQVLSLK